MVRTLRIFISSPGDVGQERLIAARVIERLQGEFAGYVSLEPILWEHEPLRASSHFQDQIVPPSETDIVICILWSRLGTRLPGQFHRPDGSSYASGTEWEFEDALESFRTRGTPDLMVYRKTAEPRASMSDEGALMQRLQQKKALDAFIDHWFGNPVDSFRAAFHAFDAPDAFETLLEAHLRRLIRERLPTHFEEETGHAGSIQWYKGSPFRGLEAFDQEHAAVFFGRTRAIADIKEALTHQAERGCAFLLVFGMSGCGKSSLIKAGVLPTITQPGIIEGIGVWRWCAFRPSDTVDDLYTGLAHDLLNPTALPELASIGYEAPELAALLREAPSRAVAALQMGMKRVADAIALEEGRTEPPQARLAIMVDQLEEIFTLERVTPAEREGFVAALGALAHSGIVWILATMRSDFYPYCAEIPELSALKEGEGQYDLRPADFAEIGQMIRYPARAAGLRFEVRPETGEKLDETLHEAATRDPEALPLLEFTLDEMFKQRTESGLLTFAAYERLGGLDGALAQRAEEVFAAQSPAAQATLPAILRRLVTVGETGEDLVAARRVRLSGLTTTPERKALLNAFIAARLLVTDRADDGEAVVRVAHEALLRRWPRLQEWLEEDKSFLQTRERVAASAKRWLQEKRDPDFLLQEGKPLANAVDLLAQRPDDLDMATSEYIRTSKHAASFARRRKLTLVVGVAALFFLVVSGFGIFSYSQWQRSERQKRLALEAVGHLTYDVPRRLIDIPGSRPVLRGIFEDNLKLLDQISDSRAISEKRINYGYVGDMWLLFGDTERAKDAYVKSLKLAEIEARDRADSGAQKALAACRTRIGDVLRQQGDFPGSLRYYAQSLLGLESLASSSVEADTHDLSVAHEKIGDAKLALNDVPGALEAYQRGLKLAKGAGEGATAAPEGARELAICYSKLGDARYAMGDLPGAEEVYTIGLRLLEKQSMILSTPDVLRDSLASYAKLGDVYLKGGNLPKAQDAYKQAMTLAQLLARDATNVRAQRDLSASFAGLVNLRLAQGDKQGALAACLQSIRIVESLPQDAGDTLSHQNLQYLYERLRDIRYLLGDQKGGLDAQERSLRMALALAKRDSSPSSRRQQATLLHEIGETKMQQGDTKGGVAAFTEALDLYRDLAQENASSSPTGH